MCSLKMQDFVFACLFFICQITDSKGSTWTVTVQAQVNGSMGQSVVLPCVFTHPRQDAYSNSITVMWIQDTFANKPFFNCSLKNKTNGQDHSCSKPKSAERFLLHGNPRKGDISLGINDLQLTDTRRYFCRVELDYDKVQSRDGILLNITAPAQILSLALDSETTAQGRMLKCIAQGNPVPVVKWSSSSGSVGNAPLFKTDHSSYRVISSVPYTEKDWYTCQAVNSLGRDEITFPANNALLLWIGILGCLLLVGLGVVIVFVIRKQCKQRAMQRDINLPTDETTRVQENETSIYVNCHPISDKNGRRQIYSIMVNKPTMTLFDEPTYGN